MQSGAYQVSQTCNFCPPSPGPRARAPVFKPPREPFSIYGGEQCVLLMTIFQNLHKRTCQPFTVFMLTINFIIISFISKTKFSVILLLPDLHSFCSLPSTNFKTDNTTINVLSIFFLPFCVFSFYSTGMICNI